MLENRLNLIEFNFQYKLEAVILFLILMLEYEMPEYEEMTFSGTTYTPRPNKWNCIASITYNFKETLEYTGSF